MEIADLTQQWQSHLSFFFWNNCHSTLSKAIILISQVCRCPSQHAALSLSPSASKPSGLQRTSAVFHHFLHCLFNSNAFPNPLQASFWETIASGMNHSASSLSEFCHPDSAMPLQYSNHQPPGRQWWRGLCHLPCSPQDGPGPSAWRVLQSPGSSSFSCVTRVYSSSSTLSLWHIMTILCWIASAPSLITVEQLIKI